MFFLLWLTIGAFFGLVLSAAVHPAVNPDDSSSAATGYGLNPVIVSIEQRIAALEQITSGAAV